MENLKNEQGKFSMMKVGAVVCGIALAIQQAGLDLVEGTAIDEKVISIVVIVGGVLGAIGARNAMGKGK